MKNIVYFDLETQKSADEVGGWDKIRDMRMSIGVTYSTARGGYEIYGEKRVDDLIRELQRADLVVGFNNLRFDYEVLHGYTIFDLSQVPTLDMLVELQKILQHRLSLDSIAAATLGLEKTSEGLQAIANAGITAFALEAAPRTTRAQSMDVLSSQANIAGYKAVMLGANEYGRFMPMMMTAAGTVKAARVIVMGVGVAGLQAIATAKRLGAVVEATDVRSETKEQVESLGAKFIEVPLTDAEKELAKGAGGYARDMGDDYRKRQAALVAEKIKQADIVIKIGRVHV